MNYKLIAVDMDGTLLNDDKSVSKANLEAIRLCLDKQVKFIISTGRPLPGFKKYSELNFINCPVILYNGAMIYDNLISKVLYEKTLLDSDANKIFEFAKNMDATVCIWSDNKLYSNRIDRWSNKYKTFSNEEIHLVNSLKDIKSKIIKFVFYNDIETVDYYKEKIKSVKFTSARFVKTGKDLLEVFNSNSSKANAMKFLGNYYNINKEEMIAIGDGDNDIDMLEYASLSIAMGNASSNIKSKAKYITKTNNDDGVAFAIKKFIK